MRQPSRIDALDRQFEILGRVQVLEVNAGLLKLHRSLQVRSTCGCTGPAGCSLPVYATSRIVLFALSAWDGQLMAWSLTSLESAMAAGHSAFPVRESDLLWARFQNDENRILCPSIIAKVALRNTVRAALTSSQTFVTITVPNQTSL
jgi:hypothetical protein